MTSQRKIFIGIVFTAALIFGLAAILGNASNLDIWHDWQNHFTNTEGSEERLEHGRMAGRELKEAAGYAAQSRESLAAARGERSGFAFNIRHSLAALKLSEERLGEAIDDLQLSGEPTAVDRPAPNADETQGDSGEGPDLFTMLEDMAYAQIQLRDAYERISAEKYQPADISPADRAVYEWRLGDIESELQGTESLLNRLAEDMATRQVAAEAAAELRRQVMAAEAVAAGEEIAPDGGQEPAELAEAPADGDEYAGYDGYDEYGAYGEYDAGAAEYAATYEEYGEYPAEGEDAVAYEEYAEYDGYDVAEAEYAAEYEEQPAEGDDGAAYGEYEGYGKSDYAAPAGIEAE